MIVDGEKLLKRLSQWGGKSLTPGLMYYGPFEEGTLENILSECQANIQPPSRIEAAIRVIEECPERQHPDYILRKWGRSSVADLLRWVLTGEKDQKTWTDEDFGLVPKESEVLKEEL